MHTKFLSTNLKTRKYLGNLGTDGRILLKLLLKEWDARLQTRLNCLWTQASDRICENGSRHLGKVRNSRFSKHTLNHTVCDAVPDEHLNLHILICLVLQPCEPCFTFHTCCDICHIHCYWQGISIYSSCPQIFNMFQFFFRNIWFWIWNCFL